MKILVTGVAVIVLLFLAIQLIPYGRARVTPPVGAVPAVWTTSHATRGASCCP